MGVVCLPAGSFFLGNPILLCCLDFVPQLNLRQLGLLIGGIIPGSRLITLSPKDSGWVKTPSKWPLPHSMAAINGGDYN